MSETEPKLTYYTVRKGTPMFRGPIGTREENPFEEAPYNFTVLRVDKTVYQGYASFFVEVESPPERKGDRFWISFTSKN